MEQRAETYRMYVSDSLFYIQHFYSNDNEKKGLLGLKLSEIYEMAEHPINPEETADDIINRMVEKSHRITGA